MRLHNYLCNELVTSLYTCSVAMYMQSILNFIASTTCGSSYGPSTIIICYFIVSLLIF